MRIRSLLIILLVSSNIYSQLSHTQTADSILYNTVNYVQAATQQQATNGVHTVVYNNILNPAYQMKKMYLDSAGTKQLSKTFYFNGALHGPYESYQMDKLLAKGRYKEGKLDGERVTYWGNGTTIMEKGNFTEGKRFGVWEYYKVDGTLRRRVTYNTSGAISQDQQF